MAALTTAGVPMVQAVGFNLFVLQNMSGEGTLQIAYASLPFFLALIAATAPIAVFPGIATWFPGWVMGR
jgi:TRAP-type C4-dicarboxylate transport system permease large subunit